MNWEEHITAEASILSGKDVIKNTRISVELIVELMAEGWTSEELLASYPALEEIHLKAVFAYLKGCMKQEFFFPPSPKSA